MIILTKILLLTGLVIFPGRYQSSDADTDSKPLAGKQDFSEEFETVVGIIEQHFYDPSKLDETWKKSVESVKCKLNSIRTRSDFDKELNRLLDGLNASHTRYYSVENPKRFQLLGIFNQLYERGREDLFLYEGIGVSTKLVDGKQMVDAVFDGFPAHKAGIRFGDVIVSVDQQEFQPIRSFTSRAEQVVDIEIFRGGRRQSIRCQVVQLDGRTMFESALRNSVRIIEHEGFNIGYLHVWSFAGSHYFDLVREHCLWGKLSECDGLVLDLRDGWGGADINYLNFFRPPIADIKSIDREGKSQDFTGTWNRPVVLLSNEKSTSGKELFLYGFKKLGLGKVVGDRSAGAVLAGRCFLLDSGDVLYLAVSDVQVDNTRIEGIGIEPDIIVKRVSDPDSDQDQQLNRAIDTVVDQLRGDASSAKTGSPK